MNELMRGKLKTKASPRFVRCYTKEEKMKRKSPATCCINGKVDAHFRFSILYAQSFTHTLTHLLHILY